MGVSVGRMRSGQKTTIELEVYGPLTAREADLLSDAINGVLRVYKVRLESKRAAGPRKKRAPRKEVIRITKHVPARKRRKRL